MDKEQKRALARILISAAGFAVAILLPLEGIAKLAVFLAVYLLIGWDVLYKAFRRIVRGQFLDENFLMSVATIGAFFIGEYPEGVVVMLFYQVGEWFQDYAVNKSRKSITELMNIRPDYAHRRLADGTLETMDPEEIKIGDYIVVKPGERVPLDGVVKDGASSLDTSALTGESMPSDIKTGDEVLSGCINLNGVLTIEVSTEFGDSTVARILKLVENASSNKSQSEKFITKFSKYYTPIVCGLALVLAIVPPLLTDFDFSKWVYRALTFLVISCPCALVISVPLSFFGGIGGASKVGILVKGGNSLERLAKAKTVVFDKTGTLTMGKFSVAEIAPNNIEEEKFLEIAAAAEYYSSHPIAQSIKTAYGKEILPQRIDNYEDISGNGVKVTFDGKNVLAGKPEWFNQLGISCPVSYGIGTVICVALENEYIGHIIIKDTIKADAHGLAAKLKALGVKHTALFTGDSKETGEDVAKSLSIDTVYTRMLPQDKVTKLEELLSAQKPGDELVFVGDGINDAPVIARADVGVAMGGLGSDAAIEAADMVLMTDEPSKVAKAIEISKKTMRIVTQNIVFALAVKALVLVLGTFGIANMWAAVFADVGVSVLAILNAMRALNSK